MSGHSKWSKIKRQKGVDDAKRGQVFTKIAREIILAARQGGPRPEGNVRLRLAIQKARDNNMPHDNIERAIKKGSGELEGATLTEAVFEGYGPSGVAILVETMSDNRNRTLQEIRNAFSKHGGNLAESGAVSWLFDRRGVITVQPESLNPDDVGLMSIDAGAEDVKVEKGFMEIYTRPEELEKVRLALAEKNIPISSSELQMVPKTMAELEEKAAIQTLKLLDKLEELDDVQHVYSNADFAESVIDKYQTAAA